MEMAIGSTPPASTWSGKRGTSARWVSVKTDWLVHEPMTALSAIHVGASSQTALLRRSAKYARGSNRWRASLPRIRASSGSSATPQR